MTRRVCLVALLCASFVSGCLKEDKDKGNQDVAVEPDGSTADMQSELPVPADVGGELSADVVPPDSGTDLGHDVGMDTGEDLVVPPDTHTPDAIEDLEQDQAVPPDVEDTLQDVDDAVQDVDDVQDATELTETICQPDCVGKECGDDGCGGDCGTCPQVAPVCNANHLCELACVPQCQGLECGPDGCGGSCGQCPDGVACMAGYCQDGPCVGKECSGHGVCSEAAGNVCVCFPGYHVEGWECLPGDFCFSGVLAVTSVTYPLGAALATGDFDGLVSKTVPFELCFVLEQAAETSCFTGADFVPCMSYAISVASASFDTDNEALLDFSQTILGIQDDIEIHYVDYSTTFTSLNLVDGPAAAGAFGFEIMQQTFSSGQAWNDPMPGPFQLNNAFIKLRKYLGAGMTDLANATATVLVE